jgi:hypothetical protein
MNFDAAPEPEQINYKGKVLRQLLSIPDIIEIYKKVLVEADIDSNPAGADKLVQDIIRIKLDLDSSISSFRESL